MDNELEPGTSVRWNKYRDLRDSGWCYGKIVRRQPRPAHNATIYLIEQASGKRVQKTFESLQIVSGVMT